MRTPPFNKSALARPSVSVRLQRVRRSGTISRGPVDQDRVSGYGQTFKPGDIPSGQLLPTETTSALAAGRSPLGLATNKAVRGTGPVGCSRIAWGCRARTRPRRRRAAVDPPKAPYASPGDPSCHRRENAPGEPRTAPDSKQGQDLPRLCERRQAGITYPAYDDGGRSRREHVPAHRSGKEREVDLSGRRSGEVPTHGRAILDEQVVGLVERRACFF